MVTVFSNPDRTNQYLTDMTVNNPHAAAADDVFRNLEVLPMTGCVLYFLAIGLNPKTATSVLVKFNNP